MTKKELPQADKPSEPSKPNRPSSTYWLIACRNCGHARHWHGDSGLAKVRIGFTCQRKHDGLAPCNCPGFVDALDPVRAEFS